MSDRGVGELSSPTRWLRESELIFEFSYSLAVSCFRYVAEKLFEKKVEMPLDLNKLFYTMYGRPAEGEVRVIFDGRAVEYVFDEKWDSDLQKKVEKAVTDYNFRNFRKYYEDL